MRRREGLGGGIAGIAGIARIVAFEWRYATRRLTFAATAGFFALMGFALSATGFGSEDAALNGTYCVTYSIGVLTLVSVFAATLLASPTLLRDSEHRMAEIVYATSVTKREYLLGRFVGALLAIGSAFVFGVAGLVAGALLVPHDPVRLAPFDALPYLWAFVVLALPGVLFVTAFLFAVAALTRSTAATYVSGVFLYLIYFGAALLTDSPMLAGSAPKLPGSFALAARLDPFGLSAFFEQTEYWTLAERNTRHLELAGHLLQNRLLVLGLAALVLAFTYRRFALRLPAGRTRSSRRRETATTTTAPAFRPTAIDEHSTWSAFVSCTRLELGALLRSWPLAALMLLWVANVAIEIVQTFRSAELGTALVAETGLLVGTLSGSLDLFGILFLVYFSTELVWRERAVRMSEVLDATPASSAAFFAAKAAALAAVLVALVVLAAGVAVLFQLATGHRPIEPLLYASLLTFGALPLVQLAVLALLLQTVSPNRHVGLLLTLLAALVLHRGAFGGPQHPLLRYAATPDLHLSTMSGLGPAALSFGWFMAYWTLFASLLALATSGLWQRGTDPRLTLRLAALPRRLGHGARRAALAIGLLFVTLGALAFWRTNVWNRYETERELATFKVDYEKTYRPRVPGAQPVVSDLRAVIDLYPAERRYRVHGRYLLTNRTAEEIAAVWVTVRRDVTSVALSLAGAAPDAPDASDRRFGTFHFDLAEAMRPGAERELAFDLTVQRRGPKADEEEADILANGSYLSGLAIFPSLGYRASYELVDDAERRRAGLGERSGQSAPETDLPASASRMTFAVSVSTPAEQLAVAPGVLVDSVVENGRRLSRFAATTPVSAVFSVASARYAVERVRHAGVDVEVYYHPSHRRNVARILEAATLALDFCTARYGPYPLPQLRLAEVPSRGLRAAGFALPGVIYLAEDRSFLTDDSDPARIDLVTKRVAHEVAHQWWGHQLTPASGPGASALVETLARHTELRVLEQRHGHAALRPVLAYELDRYLAGRIGGDEVPLLEVGDQAYLYYAKGSLVMAALAERVGEEPIDRALRDLLSESSRSGRAPTARDLLDSLRRAVPAEERAFLDESFTRIVLYDLRVTAATAVAAKREADGRTRVEVTLEARKLDATGGEERELAVDELFDVTVTSDPPDSGDAAPLYSARHRVAGSTRLSLLVAGHPRYVAIDPRLLHLDRNLADNLRRIDERP